MGLVISVDGNKYNRAAFLRVKTLLKVIIEAVTIIIDDESLLRTLLSV